MSSLPVQHLYFHIPFCAQICPYCAFYKHTPGKLANAAFVEALLDEVEACAKEFTIAPKTLYFGGGTPTLLSRKHLGRLFEGLHSLLDLSQVGSGPLRPIRRPTTVGKPSCCVTMG
jgi:oxygen-independent coproporphyrinogen-3 oxidase